MLSPLELLERERLNHLYFLERCDEEDMEETEKQITRLDTVINILKEHQREPEDAKHQ